LCRNTSMRKGEYTNGREQEQSKKPPSRGGFFSRKFHRGTPCSVQIACRSVLHPPQYCLLIGESFRYMIRTLTHTMHLFFIARQKSGDFLSKESFVHSRDERLAVSLLQNTFIV
jgi:hypothetical protein